VLLFALLMIALRGSQNRQKGQGPHPASPRDRGQEHQRNPAQPVGFHKKLLAGTNWITIDSSCGNLATTASLDRFIDSHDQWLVSCKKQVDQHHQQAAAQVSRRPFGTIKYPMIILELHIKRASHHSQNRGNGSFSRCQNGSDQEHFGPFPHSFTKGRLKVAQHLYNPFWQRQHLFLFLCKNFERSLLCLSFFVYRLDKVYLSSYLGSLTS
jgi:hypothetical protein